MRRWLRDDRGATAIEYGLIAALVVVALLVGLTAFGTATTSMYDRITTAISGASPP